MTASTWTSARCGEGIDATAHPDQGEEPEQRDHEAERAIDQQSARQPAQPGSEGERALRARAHPAVLEGVADGRRDACGPPA